MDQQNIQNDSIEVTTQKTADSLIIPLNEFSREILNRYTFAKGVFELPKFSNPKLNRYIKELAKVFNLDRRITITYIKAGKTIREAKPLHDVLTTHVGHRTFVSLKHEYRGGNAVNRAF